MKNLFPYEKDIPAEMLEGIPVAGMDYLLIWKKVLHAAVIPLAIRHNSSFFGAGVVYYR